MTEISGWSIEVSNVVGKVCFNNPKTSHEISRQVSIEVSKEDAEVSHQILV